MIASGCTAIMGRYDGRQGEKRPEGKGGAANRSITSLRCTMGGSARNYEGSVGDQRLLLEADRVSGIWSFWAILVAERKPRYARYKRNPFRPHFVWSFTGYQATHNFHCNGHTDTKVTKKERAVHESMYQRPRSSLAMSTLP